MTATIVTTGEELEQIVQLSQKNIRTNISEEEKSEILIEFEHSVPAVPKSASVSSVEFTQLILSLFKK